MVLTVASINLHRYECITEVILRTFVSYIKVPNISWEICMICVSKHHSCSVCK